MKNKNGFYLDTCICSAFDLAQLQEKFAPLTIQFVRVIGLVSLAAVLSNECH